MQIAGFRGGKIYDSEKAKLIYEINSDTVNLKLYESDSTYFFHQTNHSEPIGRVIFPGTTGNMYRKACKLIWDSV